MRVSIFRTVFNSFRGFRGLRSTPHTLSTPRCYSTTPDVVRIVEVGPRDGLQNEPMPIAVSTKVELIRRLARTGLTHIEAGAFVSASRVPQMADSDTVLSLLLKSPPPVAHSIAYNYLVPNITGLERLVRVLEAPAVQSPPQSAVVPPPITEISFFTAATDAFSRANTECTVAESLERLRPIAALAKDKGLRVRGYVSVALGCPYEGPDVSPHAVADVAASLLEMGVDEVSVGDTTGMGTAPRTQRLLSTLSAAGIASADLAMHFHDTYGQSLVNTIVALEHGVRTFDSSIAGLGGCPFSPGATGNVATEDLVYTLHSLGMRTGVDLEEMAQVGSWISGELSRANASRVGKAILARIQKEG